MSQIVWFFTQVAQIIKKYQMDERPLEITTSEKDHEVILDEEFLPSCTFIKAVNKVSHMLKLIRPFSLVLMR